MKPSGATRKEKVAAGGRGAGWRRWAVVAAACVLVLGIYAWSASSGFLEPLGSGPQDSYYNLLVRGFREGHLSVNREAPPGLLVSGVAGDKAWLDQAASGVAEMSFYKGKLYLYFGVTPALLLFWPYVALTGHFLWHKDAVWLFLSVGFLASAGLLCAVWRRYFKETGVAAVASGVLALGLANFAPVIVRRGDVYEVAVSCGYALTMLALAAVWGALQDARRGWRWLAAASLAYGLAVGARPSLLFGAVILLVPVAQAWREKRRAWPLLLAAGGPIVLIGLGLMVYNDLRFDSPFEFGLRHQVPPPSSPRELFSPRYFWFNFRVSFLEPASWNQSFPFVGDIGAPAWPSNYFGVDHPFGVLTTIPLVWLALAAPLAWRRRLREGRSGLRWFLAAVALLFGLCALTLAFYDYMALRYEMEFASPLVLLAVVGFFAVERLLAGWPVWRWVARCSWGLLLAFSVAMNFFVGVQLQAWLQCGVGVALQQKGRVDEAIPYYRRAMQLSPSYPSACYDLAIALQTKGKVDEAITQYQKTLQLQPGLADACHNLGIALMQKGRVEEAIAQFQKALQINTNLAEVQCDLGGALLQEGKVDEAITHYQSALLIAPSSLPARMALGETFLQKGMVDEAVRQYQAALQANPNSAEAHCCLGNVFLQHGKMDEAITHYQTALQLNPGYFDAVCNLGNALAGKGDLDQAIVQYQKAIETDPTNALPHNNWGVALMSKGKLEEAIVHYRKALELAPAYADALSNLGIALLHKEDFDGAMACFQQISPMSPDPLTRWYGLGNSFQQKNDWPDAITCYRQALKINPRSPEAYSNLGVALFHQGQGKEALDAWQQALEIKPDLGDAQNNLAWLLATSPDASLRDGAKALKLATQSCQSGGDGNPVMLRTLAAAYAEEGSYETAAATARRALDLATRQKQDSLAADLQKEIRLYESGAPLREAPR